MVERNFTEGLGRRPLLLRPRGAPRRSSSRPIAFWHFAVLVPDRFWGGIIGAFLAALAGAMASGLVLPWPGVPTDNPPGVGEALRAIPGAVAGLVACWAYGSRRMRSYTPP